VAAGQTCTDSDGGKNYFVKGKTTSKDGLVADDTCTKVTDNVESPIYSCEGTGCNVREYYCMAETGYAGMKGSVSSPCPNGCSNGACIQQTSSSDCGANIDCMISASGSCRASKANYTVTTTSFGINQTTKTYMEILGLDAASGKCTFFLRTERIELGFPAGTPQQTIDQYRQLYSQLEGRYGTCQFITTALTDTLTMWKLSGLFTPDATADCQGSYFSQTL
jgi:hypothetical protein